MIKYVVIFLAIQVTLNAQITKGDSLMANGNYPAALKAYDKAPQTARVFFKKARVSKALGANSEALDYYLEGFQLDSSNTRARFEYGKLELASDHFPEAFTVFQSLIQDESDNAAFHYYKGKTLSEINNTEDAIRSFEKSLELNPDYRAARIELMKGLIKDRKSILAAVLGKMYLSKHSDDIKINSLYAQALMNSKSYKEAIQVLEHLFELNNDTEYNRKSLAFAYFSNLQYEKALENYEQFLVDYDDKDPTVYFMMSKCFLNLNQLDKAQDYIERAIVFKIPNLAQEYLQLASVYANKKDLKNTLAALKTASMEDPQNDDIAYQVVIGADRYYKGKTEKLKYYERFIKDYPNSDYVPIAQERASDLKEDVFLSTDD